MLISFLILFSCTQTTRKPIVPQINTEPRFLAENKLSKIFKPSSKPRTIKKNEIVPNKEYKKNPKEITEIISNNLSEHFKNVKNFLIGRDSEVLYSYKELLEKIISELDELDINQNFYMSSLKRLGKLMAQLESKIGFFTDKNGLVIQEKLKLQKNESLENLSFNLAESKNKSIKFFPENNVYHKDEEIPELEEKFIESLNMVSEKGYGYLSDLYLLEKIFETIRSDIRLGSSTVVSQSVEDSQKSNFYEISDEIRKYIKKISDEIKENYKRENDEEVFSNNEEEMKEDILETKIKEEINKVFMYFTFNNLDSLVENLR